MFKKTITVKADKRLNNPTIKKLWKSFCLGLGEIKFVEGEENTFCFGGIELPKLKKGHEYALTVKDGAVAIKGENYGGLVRGFIAFLLKFNYGKNNEISVENVKEDSAYTLKNRMIHYCVFPEQDITHIKKLIRIAAICQYTHVVIEFWGTLKFNSLKTLSWPNAFTKSKAKEIIKEARELGLQPVPMFNHLGHASSARELLGKHVVLDQDPTMQYLFTQDGWAWDIENEKVIELLSKVRNELYEVFGEGEYIHLGCDEAYYYANCDEKRKAMPDYMKALTDQIVKEGRRPIIWVDMFLPKGKYENYYAFCKKDEVEMMMASLNKKTVLVDWQYEIKAAPIKTLDDLAKTKFDVMGAPWLDRNNQFATVETLLKNNQFGIMQTTWHTLNTDLPSILEIAKQLGVASFAWGDFCGVKTKMATIMRRVNFEGKKYEDYGFSKEQIKI